MSRMRDTVWAIDSRKDNVDSLVDRITDYMSDMNQLKVDFEHNYSNLRSKLAADIRQNVYLIFKEVINNAFRHSNRNRINVHLKQHGKSGIELSIKDNGIVDSATFKTSGTEMSNMKMRSERINGTVDINTKEGFDILLRI